MKIQFKDLSQQTTWEDLQRFANQNFETVTQLSQNNVSFSDNIDCQILTAVFPKANTDLLIQHTLKRTPTGYIPFNKSASADIYNGASAWTDTKIYLRSTVAATIKLIVF